MLSLKSSYSSLCLCILFFLLNVDCWQVLQYQGVKLYAPVKDISDPKWHFFKTCETKADHFATELTPSAPVLRYCSTFELYKIYIKNGQPRFELLILMHHTKGEHLVNFTYDDGNVYFNNKFRFKCKVWIVPPGDRTEFYILKEMREGFALWADAERKPRIPIDNGSLGHPEHEWLYVMKEGKPCFEIKVKVAVGRVNFTVHQKYTGFPTEPYDDTFFETTTTTTITVATSTTNTRSPEEDATTKPSIVNKASTMLGLIYAVCGILVLIAAALLFFLGFRLGKCFARKQALKKGLLKSGVKESNASETVSDTGAITPDASTNPVESTKTLTKAVAITPTTKTNTEKNATKGKPTKPRTPTTPTTNNETQSSAVPTESLLLSNKSNRPV